MGLLLKQSTGVTVKIGPFVDESDGKTAETALTLTQGDIRLSKNGGNMAQKNDANAATHDEIGYYDCALDATDTGTLGRLQLMVHESGALPVYHEYMVVRADIYDGQCSTDYMQVDVIQVGSGTQSATDLKDFADTGYDPTTHKVQGVVLADTTTTNTDLTAFAANYTAARAGYLDNINQAGLLQVTAARAGYLDNINQAGLLQLTAARAGYIDELAAANLPTDVAANAAAIAALNDIDADAVWDEVMDTNAPANLNSAREIMNVVSAVLAGKSSGGGTATVVFRDTGDTKNRISATVDANGNRTAVGTADGT